MLLASEAFKKIQEHAIAHKNKNTWVIEKPEFNRPYPQGDLNFWFLEKVPDLAVSVPPIKQLIEGNTRGSKHCIADADLGNVEFFCLRPIDNPLRGLILKFNAPTRIEHPEHGDHIYPANSIVVVTFQRKYAEELSRIVD